MGKIFKPSVPKYAAPAPQPTAPYVPPATDTDTGTGTGTTTPEPEGTDAVRDVIRKSARGRNSTVLTSLRGVLNNENDLQPRRKSLLGE